MITQDKRRARHIVVTGWSSWGAGCVNGARPVLGGGDAQSIKSKLYAKLERESPLYSPGAADDAGFEIIVFSRRPRYAVVRPHYALTIECVFVLVAF